MKVKTQIRAMYVFFFLLVVAAIGGWCANIYKIFTSGLEIAQWGGMEIMRVVGIFIAPLGAVLGWF